MNNFESFVSNWIEQTAYVLSQSSGKTWKGAAKASATIAADDLYIGFSTAGALSGEFGFRMAPLDALCFASALLGDESATEFTADHREALDEIFRQIAGLVTSAIKSAVGSANLTFQDRGFPTWQPAQTAYAIFTHDEISANYALVCSADLLEALAPVIEQATVAPVASETQLARLADEGNLELLLDVELGVTLRFGERRLLLREILELSSGSVVELDRQVHEPVDLLVDDRLVARGEVVIVGGNYGLRVTEVASAAHRMRAIR